MKTIYNTLVKLNNENSRAFDIIMLINELYFALFFYRLYKRKMACFSERLNIKGSQYRGIRLDASLAQQLYDFVAGLNEKYMPPHRTDQKSIKRLLKKRACFALGVFDGQRMVGYGLIRFFFPKRAVPTTWVIDEYKGKGIGGALLTLEIDLIRESGFTVFTTVAKDNIVALNNNKKRGLRVVLETDSFYVFRG